MRPAKCERRLVEGPRLFLEVLRPQYYGELTSAQRRFNLLFDDFTRWHGYVPPYRKATALKLGDQYLSLWTILGSIAQENHRNAPLKSDSCICCSRTALGRPTRARR